MALPSERELARLFNDEELAADAHDAEVIASWPSLRILDFLCEADDPTTGDIARGLNMDMGEVRDHLDALASLGIVAETNGQWKLETHQIQLRIDLQDEFSISQRVGTREEPPSPVGEQTGRESRGVVGWFTRLISRLR